MLFGNSLKAQHPTIDTMNFQLRSILNGLNIPNASVEAFYPRAVHYSPDIFWQERNTTDTNSADKFTQLYYELFHCLNDTTSIPNIKSYTIQANETRSDTVPIGILNYRFYDLIPNSLDSNIYFTYDSVDQKVYDNTNRPHSPYLLKNIFVSSVLKNSSFWTNSVFKFAPYLTRFCSLSEFDYETLGYQLQVNLNDGTGWININPSLETNIAADYDSAGFYFIETRIINTNNQVIKYHKSGIGITSKEKSSHVEGYKFNNLRIGVLHPCSSSAPANKEKAIIFLPGFNLFVNQDLAYGERSVNNYGLSELRNYGYKIYVVEYLNPVQSIQKNGVELVEFINSLKCNKDELVDFVIVGESMGGLIGRYALSYMESDKYLDRDVSCNNSYLHNTRLLVTIDSPHQGANIPLSLQETYHQISTGILKNFIPSLRLNILVDQQLNLNYYSPAAAQMLKYYVPTKQFVMGTNGEFHYLYSPHRKRQNLLTAFADSLNVEGETPGYPQFSKTFAISSGLLSKEFQLNIKQDAIIPKKGTFLSQGGFWTAVRPSKAITPVNTNPWLIYYYNLKFTPNGAGNILNYGLTKFRTVIKVRKWKIQFRTELNPNLVLNREYNTLNGEDIDRLSGGHGGTSEFEESLTGFLPHLNNGVTNSTSERLIWDIHKIDFALSDGLNFCFVPVNSALDINNSVYPETHNLMNEAVEDVMAQTPFDVIMAGMNNADGYPKEVVNGFALGRNLQHTVFRNLLLTKPNGAFELLSSSNTTSQFSGTKAQILNREIGDQFLHLENFTSYWGSNMYAEEEIIAGPKVNPRYHYCSTCSNDPAERSYNPYTNSYVIDTIDNSMRDIISGYYPHNGILSKAQRFSSPTYTSTLHSLHVTDAGWQGFVDDEIIHIEPCSKTYTYVNKKSPAKIEDSPPIEQASQNEAIGINVYPNPAQADFTVTVPESFIDGNNAQLKIADFKGKTVLTQRLINQNNNINVKDFPSGVYVITLTNHFTVLTFKLVKS